MTVRRIAAAASLAAAVSTPAESQQRDTARADTSVFRLHGISVQAARPVTSTGGTSAIEIRVDSLTTSFAPRLEEVLRAVPMINVRTNSRGEAELTLRGSESRQVAILLDGVPLTLQWDARTDVSVIPATAIRELTFTRGLSSMLHGPNVLGGVVEVAVGHGRPRTERASARVDAGYDAYGGYGSTGTLTVPVAREGGGSWLLRAGLGYRESPGEPLANGVVEPVPAADPALRLNTDTRHRDGFFSARYDAAGGGWFSLSGSGFSAERGIAAELGNPGPRLWRYPTIRRFVTVASGGTGFHDSPLGGRADVEFSAGVDAGRTEIESYATREYRDVVDFENGDDRTVTLRALADQTLGSRAQLRGAFTFADIFHREVLPDVDNEYRQRLASLGAETIVRIHDSPGRRISLGVGTAVDIGSTPVTGDKPPLDRVTDWGARAGVSASLGEGNLLLHAGVSRRGRFPSLRELYSGALDRFEPDPLLSAEHLIAFETGVTARLADADVQAVVFHHRLNDAIVRVRTESGRFQRVNRDQMRSTGVELLASRAFGRISVGADLTLQTVDLIDPSTAVKSEPENQPEAFGGVDVRFPLAFGFTAGTRAEYTGRQYCIDLATGDDSRLDAGTRFGSDITRSWNVRAAGSGWLTRIETRLAADNVGDVATYDQCGLPRPGRVLRFEVRLF